MAVISLKKAKKDERHHQQQHAKIRQMLISVTVAGSTGPLRFIVKEEELVRSVIGTALRSYARQGRLPVLRSDLDDFLLYCANAGSDALSPWEAIGSNGCRNFLLVCKKKAGEEESSGLARAMSRTSWKNWFNRSLNAKKISCH